MKRLFSSRKRIVAAAAAAGIALVGGGVIAYFTSTGSGTGNGAVGSASNWVVTVDAHTGGPLYPGSGTENAAYHIKNASTGFQNLNATTAALTTDVAGGVYDTNTNAFNDGCKATWFTVTDHSPAPVNVAGGATVNGSADVILNDSGTNQDPCQGVNPQITISAS